MFKIFGEQMAFSCRPGHKCPSTLVGLERVLSGQDSGKTTLTEQQSGPFCYDGKMMIYTLWKKIGGEKEVNPNMRGTGWPPGH